MPERHRRRFGVALVLCACGVVACESGSRYVPTPLTGLPGGVTGLSVLDQRVTLMSNEVVLGWSGPAQAYRLLIGSAPGTSDVLRVDVTSTPYTFVAPRTANTYYARVAAFSGDTPGTPSSEIIINTLDLRHIIDALFFAGGPMSEGRAVQPDSRQAAVWRAGTHLRAPVSVEAGQGIRALVQQTIDDYASAVGDAITGTTELVDDTMRSLSRPDQLPPFTVATRIHPGACLAIATGCANFGPAPFGPNAAIVSLRTAGVVNTVAHEVGHAYGLFHILRAQSDRPEFRFVMNTPNSVSALSQPEKAAIAAAFAGGIRAGTTRGQALAADLVLPFSFATAR